MSSLDTYFNVEPLVFLFSKVLTIFSAIFSAPNFTHVRLRASVTTTYYLRFIFYKCDLWPKLTHSELHTAEFGQNLTESAKISGKIVGK